MIKFPDDDDNDDGDGEFCSRIEDTLLLYVNLLCCDLIQYNVGLLGMGPSLWIAFAADGRHHDYRRGVLCYEVSGVWLGWVRC